MQESVKLFLDYMTVERGVSPNTLVAYRNDLSQLVGYMETTHPDVDFGWQDVNEEVMTAYLLRLHDQFFDAGVQEVDPIAPLRRELPGQPAMLEA